VSKCVENLHGFVCILSRMSWTLSYSSVSGWMYFVRGESDVLSMYENFEVSALKRVS